MFSPDALLNEKSASLKGFLKAVVSAVKHPVRPSKMSWLDSPVQWLVSRRIRVRLRSARVFSVSSAASELP